MSWNGKNNGNATWRPQQENAGNASTWSEFPALQTVNLDNYGIESVSSINGKPVEQPPSNWSFYPAVSSINGNSNAITGITNLSVSTINNLVFPQPDNTSNWATFRAIQTVDLSNNPIINVSTINNSVFPQVIPPDNTSNWATFRARQTVDLSNNAIINVSTINNSVFPQIIPPDRAPLWATFNAVQTVDLSNNGLINVSSINGEPFTSLSNWATFPASQTVNINNFPIINASSINGSQFPQVIPADNTSNWATFPARANVNMSNFSIVNLNQINGSVYPPPIPVQNPDRWSQYPATQNVSMANFNLNNAFNGQFNNQLTVGGIFQTTINNGDITCDNITVGNLATQQADVNIYGVNLPPGDSSLFVQGGTVLDGGGNIHGITIGTLPVGGINTQRIDVLPTGITVTTPTLFAVLGLGAISMNVAGAANVASGGVLSLAGGAYIEMNTSNVKMINTSFGNQNTTINVGRIDGPTDVNNQYPLILGNTGGAGTVLENVTTINGQPYPPPNTPSTWSLFPATQPVNFATNDLQNVSTINGLPYPPTSTSNSFPSQTFIDIKPNGTNGGDGSSFIGNYFMRMLNTGNPALLPLSSPIFVSPSIPELRLDTSSGLISIPPGNYLVDVFCPVTSVGRHRCRIQDVSSGIELAKGNNTFTSTNTFGGGASTLSCVISVFTQISIQVQQQIEFNNGFDPSSSLGIADVFGDEEQYTSVRFVRLGDPTGIPPTPPQPSNDRTWTGYMSPFFDLLPDTENALIENLSIFNVFMGPTPQIPGRQSAIAYPLEVFGQFICIVLDGGWEKTVIMEIQKAEGVGLIFRATTTQFRAQNTFPQWSPTERSLNQSIIPSMFEGGPPSEGPNQTGYAITGFTVSF